LRFCSFASGEYAVDVVFPESPTNVVTVQLEAGQSATKDYDRCFEFEVPKESDGQLAIDTETVGLGVRVQIRELRVTGGQATIDMTVERTVLEGTKSERVGNKEFRYPELAVSSGNVRFTLAVGAWTPLGGHTKSAPAPLQVRVRELPGRRGLRMEQACPTGVVTVSPPQMLPDAPPEVPTGR